MSRSKQATAQETTVSDKPKWTPGPCESLARLALQSVQYQQDGEFREAVDAVLGQSMYDAAPLMAEALRRVVNQSDRTLGHDMLISLLTLEECRAALRAAANAHFIAAAPDLLAALVSAPEPVHKDKAECNGCSATDRAYGHWYHEIRAAALAKVKA